MVQSVDSLWRRRFLGFVFCGLAVGPILFGMALARYVVQRATSGLSQADFMAWQFSNLLRSMVAIQFASLPAVLVYALVMVCLRKLRADPLVVAIVAGIAIGYLVQSLIIESVFGKLPGFSHHAEGFTDAVWLSIVGAAIGALYWFLVVRVERMLVDEQRRAAAAIRAME